MLVLFMTKLLHYKCYFIFDDKNWKMPPNMLDIKEITYMYHKTAPNYILKVRHSASYFVLSYLHNGAFSLFLWRV
jgi:hypothetical protein